MSSVVEIFLLVVVTIQTLYMIRLENRIERVEQRQRGMYTS